MPTSENFSINTSKPPSPNKGFATILVLIVVVFVAIIIGSVAYTLYFNKANTTSDSTSQPLTISQTSIETNQSSSKTGLLQQLLDKMKIYKNYQLDISLTGEKSTINWKILRVNSRQLLEDVDHPSLTIAYKDLKIGKSYTFLKDSNSYGEDKLNNAEFGLGTPEYYFKDWTNEVKTKGEDLLNGEKVTVYENVNSGTTHTAYINSVTGLPVKTYGKSPTGKSTITFKFSRINEVQESEVTLPPSAKKIVNF